MDNPASVILSLCSGTGMLDEAVKLVLPCARVACFAEWDAYAAAILLARMEDKALEPAPIWCGDLGQLHTHSFLGVVDILTAGLPCQPYSLAGKREGNTDQRSFGDGDGPLPNCLRIISECRPALVFLENVPAWVRSGWFRQFGEQLSGLGYEIIDPVFLAAGDVGANHERERVFILAYCMQQRCKVSRLAGLLDREREAPRDDLNGCDTGVDDAASSRCEGKGERTETDIEGRQCVLSEGRADVGEPKDIRHERSRETRGRGDGSSHTSTRLAEPASSGLEKRRHERGDIKQERQTTFGISPQLFAPGPGSDQWGRIIADSPHLAPAVEPGLRLLVDGVAYVVDLSRPDQLRCVGNGVVALQAALALAVLLNHSQAQLKP